MASKEKVHCCQGLMVSIRETFSKGLHAGKSAKWVPPGKILKYQFMYLVVTRTKTVHIKTDIFRTNIMY